MKTTLHAVDDEVRSGIRQWKDATVAEIELRERIIAQLRQQVSSATTVRKVVRDEDSNITAIVEVPAGSDEAQELAAQVGG